MKANKNHHPPMLAEHMYHVYNRANSNKDLLFESPENYRFFLQLYAEKMMDFVDTYVFILIPNHFHLMVKVKSETHIFMFVKNNKKWEKFQNASVSELVSEAFRRFFLSYAKAFNNFQTPKRRGSLFLKDFKRSLVDSEAYFAFLIQYIHLNCVKHHVTKDYERYQWSSYWRLLKRKKTLLPKAFLMNWFGGKQAFIDFHKNQLEAYDLQTFEL